MQTKTLRLKRALREVLIFLLLGTAGVTKTMAQDFTVGDLNYTINDDGVSVTVTGHVDGQAATGTLTIPDHVTYNETDYAVTVIGNWAFGDSEFIGDLTIPNTVTSIEEGAFYGCNGFGGSLTIPNSVITIGTCAFGWCSGFTGNLAIGNSVISIGAKAFYRCSGFTGNLTIPNGVTAIGEQAFAACSGFSGCLTISNSVITIGTCAFGWCSGFTGNLTIGNSVISIGEGAFMRCGGFTGNLTIPNSVTSIGGSAFSECSGFTGGLIIPNSVTSIGDDAFFGCSGFNGPLSISNTVTTIGTQTFMNCIGLTGNLIIPNSVTTIGYGAFYGCSGFTGNLTIPNSVTAIGEQAFAKCGGLTGSLIIPNSITSIERMTFMGCAGFTGGLSLSNTITTIGQMAFASCSGFTGDLVIPNSVTMIGYEAFGGCSGFTGNLIISNSLTSIGDLAFYECESITTIKIPNSVAFIGDEAFYYCSSLTSIKVFANTPPVLGTDVFIDVDKSIPVYVPIGTISAYQAAEGWSEFANYHELSYRTIPGYATGNDKWVFLASPLAENTAPAATTIEGLVATTVADYDLFRFNQESNGAEWQNYKAHTADFMLENGKGYLYANKEDVDVVFMGTFNEGTTQDVELDYIAGKPFAGWNLVGNPFPYAATVSRSYYVMNAEGTGLNPTAASSGTSIEACTGIMVKAETTGESVTFAKPSRKTTENNGLLHITVANEDKAIVSFNEGDELSKYYFGEQNANIYIPKNGKEYAIVSVGAGRDGVHTVSTNEIPVNFKATENGSYTLTVDMENVALDYLHLIDNMTGADIDLLQTPEYTFTAKTKDYELRFRLLFDANENGASTGSATFAYYADGEIRLVVETQDFASLQIVDMTGRIILSRDAARHVSTAGMTPGVYVLRLIEDDNVKTQKIVVR